MFLLSNDKSRDHDRHQRQHTEAYTRQHLFQALAQISPVVLGLIRCPAARNYCFRVVVPGVEKFQAVFRVQLRRLFCYTQTLVNPSCCTRLKRTCADGPLVYCFSFRNFCRRPPLIYVPLEFSDRLHSLIRRSCETNNTLAA